MAEASKGNKATEQALGDLHGAVAKELQRRIETKEASAADISAAIRFLKDNNTTAAIEDNEALRRLRQKLEERRKHTGDVTSNPERPLAAGELDEAVEGFKIH